MGAFRIFPAAQFVVFIFRFTRPAVDAVLREPLGVNYQNRNKLCGKRNPEPEYAEKVRNRRVKKQRQSHVCIKFASAEFVLQNARTKPD